MINMVAAKCPQCGADIEIDSSRESAFCTYCGAKIILTNENEHVYRHVDEAALRKTENEYALEMKKLEVSEKHREEVKKNRRIRVIIATFLLIIGLILLFLLFALERDWLLIATPIPLLCSICVYISLAFGRKKE